MKFNNFVFVFLITIFILGCVEKTSYKGRIFSENDLANFNFKNKSDLIERLGQPSYIDTQQNKYFYFTEMNKEKNFFNKKREYSYLFVFEIDSNNIIVSKKSIDLLKIDNSLYQKNETPNNIVERGLLEKIFGGVGPEQLPTNN
tara:strand:- start:197 stop:628 length:432 start_codon:yes stop_codon:yes gene_type:complete